MILPRLILVVGLGCVVSCPATPQEPHPPANLPADTTPNGNGNTVLNDRSVEDSQSPLPPVTESIRLTVSEGTALQVVLDREVRVKDVGQPVHGHLLEPVYSFDRLVLPVGTEVFGTILNIEDVSPARRTLAALDANLTPDRRLTVEFSELRLPDGKRIPIQTSVVPGSGQVIRLVSAAENERKKGLKDSAAEREQQAKQEARRQFDAAMKQVKEPGRLHRAERYALALLPVHPQYIDAGTMYFAELSKSLEFGSETLNAETAISLNSEIPDGTIVHARLLTPLNSATTKNGTAVEAVLSRPLMRDGKLIIPEGSRLRGVVVQVRPARYWKRNGQLRFVFRAMLLPNGLESKVEAMLQAVQANTSENLDLDSEGGAEPKTSKSRYLRSGIAVGLAVATHDDDPLNRAAGGAGGFKLVGIVIGATVHSQPLAIAMGAFGACRSIYDNFIARGTDVVFYKHMAMEIGVGTRGQLPAKNPGPAGN
ncbi:MAG: hypothetical protein WAK20_05985 [Candidatus Acidiferrum sp.]